MADKIEGESPKPPAKAFENLIENNRRVRIALFGGMLLFLLLVFARIMIAPPESGREVTRISAEDRVLAISILTPLVLISVIELASVGREVQAKIVAQSRWNRLTIVHAVSGFFLLTTFDLTMKWGEFVSGPVGMVIRVLWVALPLLEVGFYDYALDTDPDLPGFAEIMSSSFAIHGIGVLLLTTYIEQKVQLGFSSPDTPLWLIMADGFFELFLLFGTIYAFVWFVEQEAAVALQAKTTDEG